MIHARAADIIVRTSRSNMVTNMIQTKKFKDGRSVEEFESGTGVAYAQWNVREAVHGCECRRTVEEN